MKRGKCRGATKGARSAERVAKWSVSEILTIGDKKRNAKRSGDLLSPSVAFGDTFPEGDGVRCKLICLSISRFYATLRKNIVKRLAKNIIYCYNNDEHSFAFVVFITADF